MRTILIALMMTLATQAGADTTDQKLDLILKKLEKIETTYQQILESSEAINGLFSGGLFGTDTNAAEETSELDKILNDILDDGSLGESSENSKADELNEEPSGNDFLKVIDWAASDGGSSLAALGKIVKLKVTVKNISNRQIVLVDGFYDVNDKLGKDIMRFSIDNDLNLAPNGTHTQSGSYDAGMQFSGDMTRLINIDPKIVDFELDIDQILFEDGTKLSFE